MLIQGESAKKSLEYIENILLLKNNYNNDYYAGMDESGKGDFFGPLVTACVVAKNSDCNYWIDKGLKESKKIKSDINIFKLDNLIRNTHGVIVTITSLNMYEYNKQYIKIGSNLNYLLAWMHTQSILKAFEQRKFSFSILDQFSKIDLVSKFLNKSCLKIFSDIKAEKYPIVAAASIIARAEYIRSLSNLSSKYYQGIPLYRGAGFKVTEQAIKVLEKYSKKEWQNIVKIHFKNYEEILNKVKPTVGFEPTTNRLQSERSTIELSRQ